MELSDKTKLIICLMAPGLSIFVVFAVYPIFHAVFGSFFHWETWNMKGFAGFDIWREVLGDPLVLDMGNLFKLKLPMGALPQNMIWMFVHVPISMALGLGLALLFSDLKGGSIFRTLVFLGFTTPPMVVGMILMFIYDPQAGIFNAFLAFIGLGQFVQNWLTNWQLAIFFLIAGGIWIQAGFSMLVYHSGLAGLDPSLVEAAEVDGASAWERFKDIIWPRLKPVTAVVILMSLVWALRVFAIVYAVGGASGGPNGIYAVLGTEVFRSAFNVPIEFGRAITVAVIELIIALPIAAWSAKMRRF